MKTHSYLLVLIAFFLYPCFLSAQFVQQGSKLVGTGGDATPAQGSAVAISADGNTAVVSGIYDNTIGAVWVYTRNAGVWSQQGTKLVGTGSIDFVYQGYAMALSADGNTLIESGWRDNLDTGAVWIFTRNGGIWTQQGSKLVGSGAIGGQILQGTSVAISADGNTALVGGSGDSGTGAVWIFTRSGNVWTQHGSKLVGTGGVGQQNQGTSLAVSADGTTFATGGPIDQGYLGAVWVFVKVGNDWVQQGEKLVGNESIDASQQGASVALSADGNTLILGGPGDFINEGAFWVFTRTAGVWSQQGPKLYAEGSTSPIMVGKSVAITPDGNTAFISSPGHSGSTGIVWIFNRSEGVWTKLNSSLYGEDAAGAARQGWCVAVSSEGTVIEGGPFDDGSIGAAWIFHNPTIGISPVSGNIPAIAALGQNTPNPFTCLTRFTISIPKHAQTTVKVYDITGRVVATILDKPMDAGTYELEFNGSDLSGGTYLCKLETGKAVEMKKMVVVK